MRTLDELTAKIRTDQNDGMQKVGTLLEFRVVCSVVYVPPSRRIKVLADKVVSLRNQGAGTQLTWLKGTETTTVIGSPAAVLTRELGVTVRLAPDRVEFNR